VADLVLDAMGLAPESTGGIRPCLLPGVTVAIRLTADERAASGRNVIGVIEGADPKLSEEAVVIGAHVDHLGIFKGELYPGADDNASGVAALIEAAKALAGLEVKPKRTVVFAFWTGEEEGKFGSGYYVRHPLWPLDRTVAYLNLDMLGHPWLMEEIRKLVVDTALPDGEAFLAGIKPEAFIEPGLPPGADDLEAALRRSGGALGLALHFDRTDGVNGGSDYRDFARAGVPFIRFFGNFFPAYHEPGDAPDTLDPAQVERMARFVFATAWLLATGDALIRQAGAGFSGGSTRPLSASSK
jgi:Zn-dependent M28 family amino/carboxypeptidase